MPQELILNNVAVEVRRKKASEEDNKLLSGLTKSGADLAKLIPIDITAEEFNKTMKAVCSTIVRVQLISESLMPVLGRLLVVAKGNPEISGEWNDFTKGIQSTYGVSRSTLYEAQSFYSRWGEVVNVERFEKIGRVAISLISKAVPKGDEGKATARKLLEMAETKTVSELKSYCQERGYLQAGEESGTVFTVNCNKRQLKEFTKFFADARIHSICGSSSAGDVLERLLQEASSWLAEYEEHNGAPNGVDREVVPA